MKLWSAILVCALAFSGLNAEAARRMARLANNRAM